MSLPYPSTAGPTPLSSSLPRSEYEAMEPLLMEMASKSRGDLRRLLSAFFCFLHRRTDFYMIPNAEDVKLGIPSKMGFPEGGAEKLVLAAFRQFPLRRIPRQSGGDTTTGQQGVVAPTEKKAVDSKSSSTSVSEEGSVEKKSKAKENTSSSSPLPPTKATLTEEGKQVPVGNGGSTERYQWTQTLNETSVILRVPKDTRGKDLSVIIKPSSISVSLKHNSKEVLLDGTLTQKIRTDESTWSLEGNALLLTLDKLTPTWWETVMVGDDEIDTTMVDSTRKIHSYDDVTQGYIRKILFDQRQERLGKPTSDDLLRIDQDKVNTTSLPKGVEYIDKKKMEEIQGK